MTFDPAVFPRQLRYWSFHCLLNAAPSLGIALGWLGLWKVPAAVAAMFLAIATFILLYSTLTSLRGPFTNPTHILARSLRLGTKIRGWISAISLLVIPIDILVMITPDYWCGLIAITAVNGFARWFGMPGPVIQPDPGSDGVGFLPVYATTMLEGFILSFLLLMIAFFALILLQSRDRKKAFAGGLPPTTRDDSTRGSIG